MPYQVPSGSKSPGGTEGSGLATGWVIRNWLRLATWVVLPSGFTRTMALLVPASPCEQPAPEIMAYRVFPTNATSATPLTSPPIARLVWLEGRWVATRVTAPVRGSTREMLAELPLEV